MIFREVRIQGQLRPNLEATLLEGAEGEQKGRVKEKKVRRGLQRTLEKSEKRVKILFLWKIRYF